MKALDVLLIAASVAAGALALYAIWSAPGLLRELEEEDS